ncbi:MAG: hypothetical protein ABEI13_00105 [Candidatus Paceibacteria bacterium]
MGIGMLLLATLFATAAFTSFASYMATGYKGFIGYMASFLFGIFLVVVVV